MDDSGSMYAGGNNGNIICSGRRIRFIISKFIERSIKNAKTICSGKIDTIKRKLLTVTFYPLNSSLFNNTILLFIQQNSTYVRVRASRSLFQIDARFLNKSNTF